MARSTMATLIGYVRDLIGDPSPAPSGCSLQFSDDSIQAVLDQHRTDVFQYRLEEADDIQTTGVVAWKAFYAQKPFWETGAVMQNNSWAVVVPTTAYEIEGRWVFATTQTKLPYWITGSYYDVYAAACDLLRRWVGAVKLDFDFSQVNAAYHRSQKVRALQELIKLYQQRQPLRRIRLPRRDSANIGRRW